MKTVVRLITVTFMSIVSVSLWAQNPFLPMWEYIPDGEPYIFEDPDKPGEMRVYLYGSHDTRITDYCGQDLVVWSASVNNLSDWRYDGIIFKSDRGHDGSLLNPEGKADILMAPDIVETIGKDGEKTYFLYPNNVMGGRQTMVAKSSRPDGPFEVINWSASNTKETTGVLGFDPGVFLDDDGRVYAYWGFKNSFAAELDPSTMCTVKHGTKIIEDLIPGMEQDETFRFFEASSMRKIKDKYVLIYSRFTRDGEFGLPTINYTLAYAYSDNPLGPFNYGGTIIERARGLDDDGNIIPTASPYGNTHGSICKINDRWWVFFHRQTGENEYSRQAMVAPVDVSVVEGKGGEVRITEGEYTSEGFCIEGLNPLNKTPAGIACYLIGPQKSYTPDFMHTRPYIRPTRLSLSSYEGPFNQKLPFCPVTNITSGSIVGYKYFNFDWLQFADCIRMVLHIVPNGIEGCLTVMVGGPTETQGGRIVGSIVIDSESPKEMTEYDILLDIPSNFCGKQPLYFAFKSSVEKISLCDMYDFKFYTY